jgi:hypothetical protein
MAEKLIKDGKVAVLYSPRYGAGWYSWNTEHKDLLFHPKIVQKVLDGKREEITDEFIQDLLGINIYTGGAEDLEVEWIAEGTAFEITEHDGYERIETISNHEWLVA